MSTLTSQHRPVNDVTLETFAHGEGPPLLVLHDADVMTEWHPFLDLLADGASVLAPSHPGCGTSTRPESIDTVDDLAYLYLDLVDGLPAESVDVLGLGFGGWIAAEMAVRCCHRIRRLILADAVGIKVSGRTQVDISDTFILTREQHLDLGWHDPQLGAERMKLPGTPGLARDELLTLLRNREAVQRFAWKPFMHNPKLRPWLHRVTVPTLVLWGADDRVVSPEYGRAFAGAIPGARFQAIPASGHYPYLERPDAFVAAVQAFLS